jgi:nucleoside-diphosphate-sugar epimerase
MRALVTGSSGFLGGHVARHLSEVAGMEVSGFDMRPDPSGAFPVTVGDLADLASLARACHGVDMVVHFGGVGDVYLATEQPDLAHRTNVEGTANIGKAAAEVGARVVHASSWEVYGPPAYDPLDERHPCHPGHVYAITKLGGEEALHAARATCGLRVVILRLGTAYGTRMRPNAVFCRFADAARRGDALVVHGTGRQWRQFTHATDIARAVLLAAGSGIDGGTFNITADDSVTVLELAEIIANRYGAEVTFADAREGDPHSARISSAEALRVLGWRAQVEFRQGLSELLDDLDSRHSS